MKQNITPPNHLICPFCGGELVWSGDQNCSDISDEYNENDPAVMSNYECCSCGKSFEIWDTPMQNADHYPNYPFDLTQIINDKI